MKAEVDFDQVLAVLAGGLQDHLEPVLVVVARVHAVPIKVLVHLYRSHVGGAVNDLQALELD